MKIVIEHDTDEKQYGRVLVQTKHGGRSDVSNGDYVELTPELLDAIQKAQVEMDRVSRLLKV